MYVESLSLTALEEAASPARPSQTTAAIDRHYEKLSERPQGFDSTITAIGVKAVSDCNLRCEYQLAAAGEAQGKKSVCYEYATDDWKDRPPRFTDEDWRSLGLRIGEYAQSRKLNTMQILMHGGEPALVPKGYYLRAAELLQEALKEVGSGVKLTYAIHTNATMLTQRFLKEARQLNMRVSCSTDGTAHANRNRVTRHGKDASHLIDRGIRMVSTSCGEGCPPNCEEHFRDLFGGLLAVINLQNDPIETYEALCAYDPNIIDFNLPYHNYDDPPPNPDNLEAPYGEWLLAIYKRWMQDIDEGKRVPHIRLFGAAMNLARGACSDTEYLGLQTNQIAFVRSGGDLEGPDALTMTGDAEMTHTGMSIHTPGVLLDYEQKMAGEGMLGRKLVAEDCMSCPLLTICGGSHMATRYDPIDGLDNPSVYCADMKHLLPTIITTSNARLMNTAAKAIAQTQETTTPTPPLKRSFPTRIRPLQERDIQPLIEQLGNAFYSHFGSLALKSDVASTPEQVNHFIYTNLLPRKFDLWTNIITKRVRSSDVFVATMGSKLLGHAGVQLRGNAILIDGLYPDEAFEDDRYGVESTLLAEISQTYTLPLLATATIGSRHVEVLQRNGFRPINPKFVNNEPRLKLPPQIGMIRETATRT